ncbi:hypothetical protein CLV78_107135 [Aliiruegeria haliotis]|uniref:Uncharacterized protein n=1 Tax=Aliiruegeria haliotis TaxID=1280846 RepID=A0A2T0RM49_9RHOB|nr:hypothetical protein CLV78_107135 [Aliiruegeria haliotis]
MGDRCWYCRGLPRPVIAGNNLHRGLRRDHSHWFVCTEKSNGSHLRTDQSFQYFEKSALKPCISAGIVVAGFRPVV